MTFTRQRTRREVGGLIAASVAMIAAPAVLRAKMAAFVVVIGGGFAGASCARALRNADEKFGVTLVETNKIFTSCPLSNEVIAGLRDISAQQFTYDKMQAEGVSVMLQAATAPQWSSLHRFPARLLPYHYVHKHLGSLPFILHTGPRDFLWLLCADR